jgi:ubiquitin-conjugating enzyme E2 S
MVGTSQLHLNTRSDLMIFFAQSVSPTAMRRLMREINELKNNPPEGIRIVTSEDNMLDLTGLIEGPGTSRLPFLLAVQFAY